MIANVGGGSPLGENVPRSKAFSNVGEACSVPPKA
jgi:hypothetical protein